MVARSPDERRDPYCSRITSVRALASAVGSGLNSGAPSVQRGSRIDSGGAPIRGASAAAASDSANERREISLMKRSLPCRQTRRVLAGGRDKPAGERPDLE